MDVLAIIGLLLMFTSGGEINANTSVLAMVTQFIIGLVLVLVKLVKVIEEEIKC